MSTYWDCLQIIYDKLLEKIIGGTDDSVSLGNVSVLKDGF